MREFWGVFATICVIIAVVCTAVSILTAAGVTAAICLWVAVAALALALRDDIRRDGRLQGREVIRWFRWTVHCRRGRRCADLETITVDGEFPPGFLFIMRYRCSGCGTEYVNETLSGEDGAWTQLPRQRA